MKFTKYKNIIYIFQITGTKINCDKKIEGPKSYNNRIKFVHRPSTISSTQKERELSIKTASTRIIVSKNRN